MHQDDFDEDPQDQEPQKDPLEDIKIMFRGFLKCIAIVLWVLIALLLPVKVTLWTTALCAGIYWIWPRYHSPY